MKGTRTQLHKFFASMEKDLNTPSPSRRERLGVREMTATITALAFAALAFVLFLLSGCSVQQPLKPAPLPVVAAPVQEVVAPVQETAPPASVIAAPPVRQPDRRNIITKSTATFAFDPDHEYALTCRVGELLTIQFAPGEVYQSHANANSEMWLIDPPLFSSWKGEPVAVLIVKPGPEAPPASLIIVTDKNTYRLMLRTNGQGENRTVRYVRFRDPDAEIQREERQLAARERRKQQAVEPRFPRLDAATSRTYQVKGGPFPWQPVKVTGDHRRTFVFLPANTGAELPILSVMRGDVETRVNSRVMPGEDGAPVIIADEAFDEATLLGQGGTVTILKGN